MKKKVADTTLVYRVKREKCNTSIKELIERHSNLYYSICNKYAPTVKVQDFYLDKDYIIYKSALTFSSDKRTKFSTWLGNMTRYHCLNKKKKESKYVNLDEKELEFFINASVIERFFATDPEEIIESVFEILQSLSDKRIERIFRLRYLSGDKRMTWKDIAQEFNLTPQTIINLHKKGKNVLQRKLKKRFDKA